MPVYLRGVTPPLKLFEIAVGPKVRSVGQIKIVVGSGSSRPLAIRRGGHANFPTKMKISILIA